MNQKSVKFMHQLLHQKLPEIFAKSFTKLEAIHSHDTRQKQPRDFLPRNNKKWSQNLLAFSGAKLWTGINKKFKTLSLYALKKKIKKKINQTPLNLYSLELRKIWYRLLMNKH